MTIRSRPFLAAAIVAASLIPVSVIAHPGGWGGPGWGSPGWGDARDDWRSPRRDRDTAPGGEGRVSVSRFVSDNPLAAELGHGAITVSSQSPGTSYMASSDRAAFEAALVDRLVKAGYDTTESSPQGGQIAELTVTRTELAPAERRNKVSGTAATEVSNRGSAFGLAVNLDLTKPLGALVSTRLEARIRDRATNTVLWEGRADVATREGGKEWSDQEIASRLAGALLDGFPRANDGIPQRD